MNYEMRLSIQHSAFSIQPLAPNLPNALESNLSPLCFLCHIYAYLQ